MEKNDNIKAYSAAVTFAVLVGFTFLGIKKCIPVASSLEILTYRYNFAFAALIVLLIFRIVKLKWTKKPKRDLMLTAAFYIGFMILQVIGLKFATSIEAAIIFALVPIIAQIIAFIFLGEKSTALQNVFVCIVVAALIFMIVLGASDLSINFAGVIILLVSSICMGISNVFMRYLRDFYRPAEITATIVIMGFAVLNIATVAIGLYNGTLGDYFDPCRDTDFVIATIYLGVGCILISSQLISYMLSKMKAVNATVFGNVSTAISIVAGVVILGEPLEYYHIICAAVIVAGVIGLSIAESRVGPGKGKEK